VVFKPDLATSAIDSPVSTEETPAVKDLFRVVPEAFTVYRPKVVCSVRKLTPGPNKFANAGQRAQRDLDLAAAAQEMEGDCGDSSSGTAAAAEPSSTGVIVRNGCMKTKEAADLKVGLPPVKEALSASVVFGFVSGMLLVCFCVCVLCSCCASSRVLFVAMFP
jgi:hypothetical protein